MYYVINIILYKSSGSSIGRAENWRFLGCKFKSYSGQKLFNRCAEISI